MQLSSEELFDYAEEVTNALTDVYAQNHQLNKQHGMLLNGLGNFALGIIDLSLNGSKANTPLLGLYYLFQAENRQKPTPVNKPDLDLAPELRQQALPRPRPC